MIHAAIYGLGGWGKTLVNAVQGKSGKIRFVAGVARSVENHKDYGNEMGISLSDDYEAVLRDPAIDAVVLTTPHSLHADHVRLAAAAGKHVFVEKPLTLTKASAVEAMQACHKAGVVLAVGFNRRFLPSFKDMNMLINEGRIGNILHVEGQFSGPSGYRRQPGSWRAERAENPVGGMTARGIHALDIMINLCGEIASVQAMSDRREISIDTDDTTSMLLRFRNGVTGYLGTIMATGNFWRVHVFGSKGWIEMHGEASLTLSDLDGVTDSRQYDPIDLERAELENFTDAVERGIPFAVSTPESVHGISVLETIVESARSGGVVEVR